MNIAVWIATSIIKGTFKELQRELKNIGLEKRNVSSIFFMNH
ncbi:hypothetical protein B4079_1812 [Bacillus cereus]|nr:hypothetical protein bcere0029_55000 [Bacillus cereus AH1272]EEL90376.1 hypothetical protein bcere0030_56970 [Bacillus cereus AH1273]KYQ03038.1 hypothetical protein B4079_1812 [Bacillus cereus]